MDLTESDLGEAVSRSALSKASPKRSPSLAAAALADPDDAGSPGAPRSARKKKSHSRGRSLSSLPPRGQSPLFRSSTALHILTGGRKSPASLPALSLQPMAAFSLPGAAVGSKHTHAPHAHHQIAPQSHPAPHAATAAASPGTHNKPKPSFRAPPRSALEAQRQALPIAASRAEILQAVRDNDTIVLIGETGSGKTTQVPQYLLSSGLLGSLGVGVTQPRRVAATSVATRVAEEVGTTLGNVVGYSVRFDDTSSAQTRIKYLTDGMLLAELVADPLLLKYNALVLDEAHERTVNTDVLFALLRKVQGRRKAIVRARGEQNKQRKQAEKRKRDEASRSPHRSPAASSAAAAAAKSPLPFAVDPASDSPDMRPLDLATDETPPLSRAERKEAKKKRRRDERERAQRVARGEEHPATAVPAARASAASSAPAPVPALAPTGLGGIDSDSLPSNILSLIPSHILSKLGELKIVVMSATLAAESFAVYFSAPILRVPGRTYPVDIFYAEQAEVDYIDAVVVSVLQLHMDPENQGVEGEAPGDVLVFLTGGEEIESVSKTLRDRVGRLSPEDVPVDMVVIPLYASLSPESQMAVFVPAARMYPHRVVRKVILATNVAETSLTIPGIRFVVDSGVVKQRMYTSGIRGTVAAAAVAGGMGMEVLKVVDISQAEANQRSGRAGRDAPGQAFRLYTEQAFGAMRAQIIPEILRSNLASVVLNLKALGVGNILAFEFLTPPSRAGLTRALEELYALRALNYNGELSDMGRRMVAFPLPPAWARILLQSTERTMDCAVEVTKILSIMSVEGGVFFHVPRSAQAGTALSSEGKAAAAARRQFAHSEGDHFTYLDAFNAFLAQGTVMGERGVMEWCRSHGLHYKSLVKARKIFDQLAGIVRKLGLQFNSSQVREEANEFAPCTTTESIKKCLLFGLFGQVARKQAKDASYLLLSNNSPAYIHPSSVLIGKSAAQRPELVVFNTLIHTSRTYMRECMVLPELKWLAELVPEHFGDAAGAEGAAPRIKGGREQSELHARLAQSNANGSKMTAVRAATAETGSLKNKQAVSASTNANGSNGKSSHAQQLSKKQKQSHPTPPAATPAAFAASFSDEPAAKLPKQKKVKRDTTKAGSLMDFINTM